MSADPPLETKSSPRVFISYSHDSAEHCERVLALASWLRSDGINAQIDQFETSPSQGWPRWCARQILDSNYVLIICTAAYRDRFLGLEKFGKGRGVKWEAKVIHNILYYEEVNSGFIPVIFDPSDADHIPETVKDASWYLVAPNGGDSSGYDQLRQRLTGDKTFPPLRIPPPSEAYRERDDASVPTEEVWDASSRIEEKLDNLRRLQKRQHRTVMASFAVVAVLLLALLTGIIWSKISTEKIVTDSGILRTKLEEKIKESFEKQHRELVARKATPAEMDQLYRRQETALRHVGESVQFIQSATKDAQATIAKKVAQIVEEDGVDRALKYLEQTISGEAARHKERARELAEASLLKAELQLIKLDYDSAENAIKQAIEFDYEWWEPHNRLGFLFYRKTEWNAAEAEYTEARRFVDSEENTATILNNLALLLRATNRVAEGEPLMRQALAIYEKSNEPEHPNLATALNNLAAVLQDTNRLAEAEPLMRRALAIDEKSHGPNHPDVARDLNNLALLLQKTNRLAEAEPLMRRALASGEKSFGPEHPEIAVRLNNLAVFLKDTNRLVEAEPLMRRALAIDEKSYGPDHPNVAVHLSNLSLLLQATNRLAEAEPLIRRALAIDEKSFGSEHPDVARDLNNLATLLQLTNRLAEAKTLMQRVVEIFEKSRGKDHPRVAVALSNLAQLLQATNRLAEAEPLMRRALAIDEKSFGPEHPDVARDLHILALLFEATNRLVEAEPLMRRSVVIFLKFKRSTGHLHPLLKIALGNYRITLEEMSLGEDEIARRIAEVGKEAGLDEESYSALLAELSK